MSITKTFLLVTSMLLVLIPSVGDAAGNMKSGPGGIAAGQQFPARPGWFVQAGRNRGPYAGGPVGGPADPGSLTVEEIHYLYLMRVEEMLARNVYITFDEQWNLQVFGAISESEQRHMQAMEDLMTRYQQVDPVTPAMEAATNLFPDEPLAVTGDTFYDLYVYLTGLGTTVDTNHTQVDPLTVGALIEERDMLDIWNAIEATDNEDVVAVYQSLLCGSRNHLRAFVYQLEEIYGDEDYAAQIVIAAEPVVPEAIIDQMYWQTFIDEIIDSDTERCGRRVAETE